VRGLTNDLRTVAHTKLVQCFYNFSDHRITKVRYLFPLYDGAAVTGLTCHVGDDITLVGRVKPKEDASVEFKKAVKQQRAAALLEEQTAEIFETVVGNIPPNTDVRVEIQYVSSLKVSLHNGLNEELCFVIPMSIAPRYGGNLSRYEDSQTPPIDPAEDGLNIIVQIVNDGSVCDLRPNFACRTSTKPSIINGPRSGGGEIVKTAIATSLMGLSYGPARTVLERDFVLVIGVSPTHSLSSRAVLSPTI